jgi:hypothetical protein
MKYDVDGHAPKTPMLFLYQNGFHNATNARNGVIKEKKLIAKSTTLLQAIEKLVSQLSGQHLNFSLKNTSIHLSQAFTTTINEKEAGCSLSCIISPVSCNLLCSRAKVFLTHCPSHQHHQEADPSLTILFSMASPIY